MTTLEAYPPLTWEGPAAKHSSGFWPAVALGVLSFLTLALVGHEKTSSLTIILTGSACCAGLIFCVWRKYRGRWELNGETAFLLGMFIQFLFCPVIFRLLMPDESLDYRIMGGTSERLEVKAFWTQGFLLTSAFLGVFLAVSALIPLPKDRRLMDGRLSLIFTKRSVIIMIMLGIMLWMIRSYLVATGSFYHQFRSEFQSEDWRYSGWTQFDGGVGPVIVAFFFAAAFSGHIGFTWATIYALFDAFFNFLSGSRSRAIAGSAAVVLTYIVYRRKLPIKGILIMCIPALLFLGYMDQYRQLVHKYADVNKIDLTRLFQAATRAEENTDRHGPMFTIMTTLGRLAELDSPARIYQGVPSEQPFLNGETYENVFISIIPRQLWKDKPQVNLKINYYFFRHEGGQSPDTIMGEGYLNWGYPGIVLAAIGAALLVRFYDWLMRKMLVTVGVLPVYIGFCVVCARLPVETMGIWFSSFPKALLLMVIVWLFSTRMGTPAGAQDAALPAEAAPV